MVDLLIKLQKWIYDSLGVHLTAFAATRDWAALAAVLPLGVVFGAIHALTPGHGKSVLASYVLGSRLAMLRAAAVAFALATVHVGTAVVIALTALPLVTRGLAGVGRSPSLETVSRLLLVAIGVWLIGRALRGRPHVHREGIVVGLAAGLVPCPLTLFVMIFALSRKVPEAGLMFALAMMLGVLLTLTATAAITVIARDWMLGLLAQHGASMHRILRVLDGVAGALLVCFSLLPWLGS